MATISNSSRKESLFLFAFLLSIEMIDVCLGVSLDLTGSLEYAVLNQSFTLTCTATEAAGLSDLVKFYKNTDAPSNEFASLSQSASGCAMFAAPPDGYSVSCGSGTSTSSSTTKLYSLIINRAADIDAIDWLCGLNTAGTRSKLFTLQFKIPPKSSCIFCIGFTVTLTVLMVIGIILVVVFFAGQVNDAVKKILAIIILIDGIFVFVLAITGVGLLASDTNLEKDAQWIAAVAICAIGLLGGIIFGIFGVVKLSQIGKHASESVSNAPSGTENARPPGNDKPPGYVRAPKSDKPSGNDVPLTHSNGHR